MRSRMSDLRKTRFVRHKVKAKWREKERFAFSRLMHLFRALRAHVQELPQLVQLLARVIGAQDWSDTVEDLGNVCQILLQRRYDHLHCHAVLRGPLLAGARALPQSSVEARTRPLAGKAQQLGGALGHVAGGPGSAF